ncbi:MAG: helix-turn-helix transcriptional regulator [Chloroflexi bacterium]|nr:helix-turn-helix transcriptional regulator [Chloroflexota bacterium]
MSKNLWELRKQRNLTVKQLAAKSGVLAKNIYAYEAGEQVKIADLDKLARALFVDRAEIKFQSDPIPKNKPEPPAPKPPKPVQQPKPPQADQARAEEKPSTPKKAKKEQKTLPATDGQIAHLLGLGQNLGLDETAVTEQIGKPLNELTFHEARSWLGVYDREMKTKKASQGVRPPDTRRWRALTPEGVDEYEARYLQTRQEAGDAVAFTLLDETTFTGRIIGFSPFNITIQQADGVETTINKLALAYYQVAPAAAEEAA